MLGVPVYGHVDHASGTAAAAEDDAVGVALNPVQNLGVTDHGGKLPPSGA